MTSSSNPYSQARPPRRKRSRDESASPRPAQRQRTEARDGPGPKRHRSQSPRSKSSQQPARGPPQASSGDATRRAEETPRPRKRPGGGARISAAQREAAEARARQREADHERREAEFASQAPRTGIHDAVREHYNLVPQRGRDWRRTESKIKGLREFNNWIKSVLIQKFSASDDMSPGAQEQNKGFRGRPGEEILVLDVGCGKGGDLFKWQKAPQRVALYVGIDPAEISISQARGRYQDARRKSRGRIFHAEFYARDGFGQWIGDIPIVKEVGIDAEVGPGTSSRWGGGGFDVVTMMFCMHYAMESEEKARGMLRNVAGALKKGGRLIGVLPSSDVIRDNVERFYNEWDKKKKSAGQRAGDGPKDTDATKANGDSSAQANTDQGPVSPSFTPESPSFVPDSPAFMPESPTFAPESPSADASRERPEKDAIGAVNGEKSEAGNAEDAEASPDNPEPKWGNSLYHVRFPSGTPRDGVFRPPFGWKYQFFLDEAVEEVPEYVVPFEAFRAMAEDYNLELAYRKPFLEIWEDEREDGELGPLSVRMGVTDRIGNGLRMSEEEREAASFYLGFCFVKL